MKLGVRFGRGPALHSGTGREGGNVNWMDAMILALVGTVTLAILARGVMRFFRSSGTSSESTCPHCSNHHEARS